MRFLRNLFIKEDNKMDNMSEKQPGANKGRVLWNNGSIQRMSVECPGEGFVKGRLIREEATEDNSQDFSNTVSSEFGAKITSPRSNNILKFYKIRENATIPKYQTKHSAGFDLHACLDAGTTITAYNLNNRKVEIPVKTNQDGETFVIISPGSRYLIPTGLIADIQSSNQMLEINPRSGLSLKQGIILANCTGIIDSDYVEELFVMVMNVSDVTVIINHGDRIAQGIISKIDQVEISEVTDRPTQKTERNGGFGSTGEK